MHQQLKFLCFLSVLIALLSDLSFEVGLLIKLNVEFVDFFLKAFDSLSINVFHPGHLLVLSFELLLVSGAHLFLDVLDVLKRTYLHLVSLLLHLAESFAHGLDFLVLAPFYLSELLDHLYSFFLEPLIFKIGFFKPLLQLRIDLTH